MDRRIRYLIFPFPCLFLILAVQPAYAQTDTKAFQNATFSVSPTFNTNRNSFHDYWEPGTGFNLNARMPFYAGEVHLGAAALPYSGKADEQPDYWSIYMYLGWGASLSVFDNFRLGAGVKAGSYQFRFDEEEELKHRKSETEFCAGLFSDLNWAFHDDWAINLSGSYLKIYTAKRIKLVYLSAGISRRFDLPGWLTGLLQ